MNNRNPSRSKIRKEKKSNIQLMHKSRVLYYWATEHQENSYRYTQIMNTIDSITDELKEKEKDFLTAVVKLEDNQGDFAPKARLIKKMFLWIDKTIHKLYNNKGEDNMEIE